MYFAKSILLFILTLLLLEGQTGIKKGNGFSKDMVGASQIFKKLKELVLFISVIKDYYYKSQKGHRKLIYIYKTKFERCPAKPLVNASNLIDIIISSSKFAREASLPSY